MVPRNLAAISRVKRSFLEELVQLHLFYYNEGSIIRVDGTVWVLLGMPHGAQVHCVTYTTLVAISCTVVAFGWLHLLAPEHL